MDGQRRMLGIVGAGLGGHRLDAVIVGDQRGDLAVGDPLEQALVAAVEDAAHRMGARRIDVLVHLHDLVGEAGVEQQHVARLDHDPVGLEHLHQVVVVHVAMVAPEMLLEIDQHGAALDRLLRHVLDAELVGVAEMAAAVAAGIGLRADHVHAGLEAVVVELLGHAVAVGIEQPADMGERVPLGRILKRQDHTIVAHRIDEQWIERIGEEVEAPAILVAGRRQDRRQAARVQHVAAGQIEWEREAERAAFLHLGNAFEHLPGRDQVETAQLIVVAPIAPSRALGPVFPALHCLLPPMRRETRHACQP